jgi:hypothetical protein
MPEPAARALMGVEVLAGLGKIRKTGFARKIGERSRGRVSGDRGRARRGMVLVAEERLAWPKRMFRAVYRCDWIVMFVALAAIGGGMAALVFISG